MKTEKPRILILDEDSSTLTTFRIALSTESYDVVTRVPNCQEIARLTDGQFSLVIVVQDYSSASEIVSALQTRAPSCPVLFLTSSEEWQGSESPHPNSQIMVKSKPNDPSVLRKIVEQTLAGRQDQVET